MQAASKRPATVRTRQGLWHSWHAVARCVAGHDRGLARSAQGGGYDEGVVTEEDVREALEEVIDPELGLDFVSLGLVYDIEIEDGEVYITFTLTTPACPIGPQVTEQMKEFVGELDEVERVHPKMVFDPPWSPEMMTEDAKFALGF
jgi:metal-sulfur cluster biosynthetic enzyme